MFDFEPVRTDLRAHMLAELGLDITNNKTYINPFVKRDRGPRYLELLRAALASGSVETFAAAIAANDLLIEKHTYTKQGRLIEARVPATFNVTLAAGEFNRYYMRAICRLALQEGKPNTEIYRAKAVKTARLEKDDRLGRCIEPQALLSDLRQTSFESPSAFGLGGPNSGLSIRIPAE